jgi:hypothetical protein
MKNARRCSRRRAVFGRKRRARKLRRDGTKLRRIFVLRKGAARLVPS